jgi:septal ring factor EnvC (AmiA/AmiB activator)
VTLCACAQDELDKLRKGMEDISRQLDSAKKAGRECNEKVAELEDDLADEKKAKARLEDLRKQLEKDLAAAQAETDAANAKVAVLEKAKVGVSVCVCACVG